MKQKHARKLSQHFLNSTKFAQRIATSASIKDSTVIEIGPGRGILTKEIALLAAKVIAIELDPEMLRNLNALALPGVRVIHDDFLRHDIGQYGQIAVIGNIPYRISSAIIEKIIENHKVISSATLTVQREFAQRLVALPGERMYGFLSLYAGNYYSIARLFSIAPRFFTPVPEVNSTVVRMTRNPAPCLLRNEKEFFDFVRKIFCYPRKSVRNAVKRAGIVVPTEIDRTVLDKRPASLSISDYLTMYNACMEYHNE